MVATTETIAAVEDATGAYKYGFVTDIETEKAPKGLNEDIIAFISAKKDEPEWMLEWRLKAYRHWLKMASPDWAKLNIPAIDYQDVYYYAAPKSAEGPKSLDEVDPELLAGQPIWLAAPQFGKHWKRPWCQRSLGRSCR